MKSELSAPGEASNPFSFMTSMRVTVSLSASKQSSWIA